MLDCKNCSNPCVEAKTDSKVEIHGNRVIACVYCDSLPSGDLNVILDGLEKAVEQCCQQLGIRSNNSQNAFNNIRGAWTRFIFGAICWNAFCGYVDKYNACIVSLPSIARLKFIDLFDTDAAEALKQLLRSLTSHGIELTMSNPDFVCVKDILPDDIDIFKSPIVNLSPESQHILIDSYEKIKDCCRYDSVKFGIALKTSLRSDRRYQVVYEGSTLKAFIAHLQVRFWDIDFKTNYYAVVANNVNDSDRIVLSAPAIHSIVDVHTQPIKAIDAIYEVRSTDDICKCINKMIEANFDSAE
jgi:hypothetical protein